MKTLTNVTTVNTETTEKESTEMKDTNKLWAWTKEKVVAIVERVQESPRLAKTLTFIIRECFRVFNHVAGLLGLPALVGLVAYSAYKGYKEEEADLESVTFVCVAYGAIVATAVVGAAVVVATETVAIAAAIVATTLAISYAHSAFRFFFGKKEA